MKIQTDSTRSLSKTPETSVEAPLQELQAAAPVPAKNAAKVQRAQAFYDAHVEVQNFLHDISKASGGDLYKRFRRQANKATAAGWGSGVGTVGSAAAIIVGAATGTGSMLAMGIASAVAGVAGVVGFSTRWSNRTNKQYKIGGGTPSDAIVRALERQFHDGTTIEKAAYGRLHAVCEELVLSDELLLSKDSTDRLSQLAAYTSNPQVVPVEDCETAARFAAVLDLRFEPNASDTERTATLKRFIRAFETMEPEERSMVVDDIRTNIQENRESWKLPENLLARLERTLDSEGVSFEP